MGKLIENIEAAKSTLKEAYGSHHSAAIASAIRHIDQAVSDLKKVDDQPAEDLKYFIGQLQQILSSDHDEAGLIPFKRNIDQRIIG